MAVNFKLTIFCDDTVGSLVDEYQLYLMIC